MRGLARQVRWLHELGEVSKDPRINSIGFGQASAGSSKIAHLAWIHHCHWEPGRG
jgi:hypothetical protein